MKSKRRMSAEPILGSQAVPAALVDAEPAAGAAAAAGICPLPVVRATVLAAALAAFLAGCASTHGIAPQRSAPSAQTEAQRLGLTAPATAEPSAAWWQGYGDAQLDHWVALALDGSPTLLQADDRLKLAQAAVTDAQAASGLSVGAQASSTATRLSSNGIYPPPLGGMVHTINDVDLTAAIELDAFGRLRARTDAARLAERAVAADREAARVQLAAAVAQAYFQLALAQRAQALAQETERQRQEVLALVQARVKAGFDTLVEQRLAEGDIPQARGEVEIEAEHIELARHALAVLAGQPPQAAAGLEARLPPSAHLAPPASLPLDLLARRADIAAAQLRIQSALRNVDAARADFYPNINLSGLIGLDSLTLSPLLRYSSRTWDVGPAVHLPLFESGRLRAQLQADSAQADAAVAAYEGTVTEAARQVADALASIASVARQREQQRQASASAQQGLDLARLRYRAGLTPFLVVLAAEGRVLAEQRAELALQARTATLDVDLARVLGGGFRADAAPLAAR